jgi:hypothetical protein
MNDSRMASRSTGASQAPEVLASLARMAWSVVRIPALAFLIVLEPVVGVVLAGLSLFGILVTFLFKWTSVDPRFPFWMMLGISIGFGVMLFLYEGLISLMSRR